MISETKGQKKIPRPKNWRQKVENLGGGGVQKCGIPRKCLESQKEKKENSSKVNLRK